MKMKLAILALAATPGAAFLRAGEPCVVRKQSKSELYIAEELMATTSLVEETSSLLAFAEGFSLGALTVPTLASAATKFAAKKDRKQRTTKATQFNARSMVSEATKNDGGKRAMSGNTSAAALAAAGISLFAVLGSGNGFGLRLLAAADPTLSSSVPFTTAVASFKEVHEAVQKDMKIGKAAEIMPATNGKAAAKLDAVYDNLLQKLEEAKVVDEPADVGGMFSASMMSANEGNVASQSNVKMDMMASKIGAEAVMDGITAAEPRAKLKAPHESFATRLEVTNENKRKVPHQTFATKMGTTLPYDNQPKEMELASVLPQNSQASNLVGDVKTSRARKALHESYATQMEATYDTLLKKLEAAEVKYYGLDATTAVERNGGIPARRGGEISTSPTAAEAVEAAATPVSSSEGITPPAGFGMSRDSVSAQQLATSSFGTIRQQIESSSLNINAATTTSSESISPPAGFGTSKASKPQGISPPAGFGMSKDSKRQQSSTSSSLLDNGLDKPEIVAGAVAAGGLGVGLATAASRKKKEVDYMARNTRFSESSAAPSSRSGLSSPSSSSSSYSMGTYPSRTQSSGVTGLAGATRPSRSSYAGYPSAFDSRKSMDLGTTKTSSHSSRIPLSSAAASSGSSLSSRSSSSYTTGAYSSRIQNSVGTQSAGATRPSSSSSYAGYPSAFENRKGTELGTTRTTSHSSRIPKSSAAASPRSGLSSSSSSSASPASSSYTMEAYPSNVQNSGGTELAGAARPSSSDSYAGYPSSFEKRNNIEQGTTKTSSRSSRRRNVKTTVKPISDDYSRYLATLENSNMSETDGGVASLLAAELEEAFVPRMPYKALVAEKAKKLETLSLADLSAKELKLVEAILAEEERLGGAPYNAWWDKSWGHFYESSSNTGEWRAMQF